MAASSFYTSSIVLIAGVPAIGDFLFGLDIGVSSYAIDLWKNNEHSPSALLLGMLVSAPSAGAFVAGFVVFFTSSRTTIGPKRELQIAAALYLVGSILCALSGWGSSSMKLLLVARWLYGGGVAFGLHGATTYMGEMLPTIIRGSLMSLNEVSIVTGILAGYLVGYINTAASATTTRSVGSWSYIYIPAVCLSTIMLWLCTMYLEESARWLALQGRTEEALKAWKFVWKPSECDDDTAITRDDVEDPIPWLTEASVGPTPQSSFEYKMLLHPRHRPALVAGWGLVALLQLTGQPTVLSYAAPILHHYMGLSTSTAVVVAMFKIFMTVLVLACADRLGRKTLLCIGCSAMLVGLVGLIGTTILDDNGDSHSSPSSSRSSVILLIAMLVYIGGYQVGFGTMIWLVTTEIFSNPTIRGPGVAVAVQINFGLHAIVECVVPLVQEQFGLSTLFLFFGIATTLSLWFLFRHVPETKGLSLEEIEDQLLLLSSSRSTTNNHDDDDDERVPIISPNNSS